MTIVRVRFTPNGVPQAGEISFHPRHDKDNRPIVSGRDILNGNPEWLPVPVEGAGIDVPPLEAGLHYVVSARTEGVPQQTGTFIVPRIGPVDFGDLVRYDPKAGMAYEPDPDWWAHTAAVENGIDGVQADLHLAVSQAAGYASAADADRGAAGAHAVSAQDAATQAQLARDQTVALGFVVDNSAGTKVSVGTTVVFYDSGQRSITSLVEPTFGFDFTVPGGHLRIARVGGVVTLSIRAALTRSANKTTRSNFLLNVPSAFRQSPAGFGPLGILRDSGGDLAWVDNISSSAYLAIQGSGAGQWTGQIISGSFSWTTNAPYPTSLPGTPA